jgi:hypothetical protein
MNGKGDKIRTGSNLKAYRDNYDMIFKKKEPKDDSFEIPTECSYSEYQKRLKSTTDKIMRLNESNNAWVGE